MMKKLLFALTFALTLAVAFTAFAQTPPVGPKLGGDLTSFMNLASSTGPDFLGRLRLTINGEVSQRVGYTAGLVNWFVPGDDIFYQVDRYLPQKGNIYLPFLDYGFASFRDVGPTTRIDVGAIPVNRSPLKHFEGLFFPGFRFTGAMATSRLASNAAISLGVGPVSDHTNKLHGNMLGDLQYEASFGDFGVGALQFYSPNNDAYLRLFGLRAAIPVMGDRARIYGEAGVSQAFKPSSAGAVYQDPITSAIIGVNLPRLARMTGFDVAGEYDLTENILGWQVAKNLMPGVTFKTEGDYEIGSHSGHNFTAQTSLMVSF